MGITGTVLTTFRRWKSVHRSASFLAKKPQKPSNHSLSQTPVSFFPPPCPPFSQVPHPLTNIFEKKWKLAICFSKNPRRPAKLSRQSLLMISILRTKRKLWTLRAKTTGHGYLCGTKPGLPAFLSDAEDNSVKLRTLSQKVEALEAEQASLRQERASLRQEGASLRQEVTRMLREIEVKSLRKASLSNQDTKRKNFY